MSDQTVKRSCLSPHLPGLLSPDELRAAVHSGDIATVMLAVPDMMGRLKGKRLSASVFLDRMLAKAEACAYILATDVDMTPLEGFDLTGWDDGYGDLSVIPSQDTIRVLPYMPGAALIHADVADEDGELLEIAPRHMLRTQLDKLAALGLEVRVGLESEFVLYQGSPLQAHAARYRGLQPVAFHNLDYALDHPPALTDFFQHLEDALHGAGAPVESVKTEGAPGQLEITFPYGPAMTACDAYTVYKHAVRHIAQRRGMTPTFMAAPQTGIGSGLHIHISLLDVADYRNAFATRPDEEELPETMQRAIAGLISAMPHLAPLYAPHANSYKRYNPHSFAPTRFAWGYDNRSCAIRVTGHGTGRHLEVRLPGADANPYLALTATLATIHHGLITEPELPPPTAGDAYQAPDALPVPRDLVEALADFDDSKIAQNAFGAPVVRHYAHATQHEIDAHRGHVTDLELDRGFLRA
ncbi:glutamine synthetase family protein [Streptomyces sp. WAC00263]|uniref:glutamine synthetase family protein n=1 Tax=Streptomyces sp. WAC00263 TaxID=1917422 RepID=UPI0015EE76F8|nr:glutamine synthetase family protein [Streptomyces sp. WAC00263]KAF5998831.1 glutamine synthetase [Streptomyces sp. WAC00263]